MNIQLSYKWKIALIVSLVIVIILSIFFITRLNKSANKSSETDIVDATELKQFPLKDDVANSNILENGTEITIEENNIVTDNNKFYLANLPQPLPGILTSGNGNYAIGQFFEIENDNISYYLLQPDGNPLPLNAAIESVAKVNNDGTLIYFAYGNVYKGKYDRSNEQLLIDNTELTSEYVGFATLDDDTLLVWGEPTQPSGQNLYRYSISTDQLTSIISDQTVVNVKVASDQTMLIVERYVNDNMSNWLYSMPENQFTKQLPYHFNLDTTAWTKDLTHIAYWRSNSIYIMNLETLTSALVKKYSEGDVTINGKLEFINDTITIYPTIDPWGES